MTLAEANPAAREATGAVAMVERAPYRRRDRARTRADFDDTAVTAVLHYHAARVARDAPRRFCRNARAVFEERLAGLIGVGEDRRIDVDDARVELADEVEEACGRGVEMSRQLGDLVTQSIEVSRASLRGEQVHDESPFRGRLYTRVPEAPGRHVERRSRRRRDFCDDHARAVSSRLCGPLDRDS